MRIFNRLLAFVFALAIAAAAVITVIEVIAQRAFSRGPVVIDWRAMLRWGQRNTWQAFSVELACGAMAVIGLILLMLQLKRRRPNKVSLRAADANNSVALTRKGTAATVRSAVLDVEGISAATVKVSHRRIAVKARSAATTDSEAKTYCEPVHEAVRDQLAPLQLQHDRRVVVKIRNRNREEAD